MKLNEAGYKLITSFEGLSLKPYLDVVKVPTIGYGNTYYPDGKKVSMSDHSITQDYAFEMFKTIADSFALAVNSRLKKPVTQNQFNAMVSLAYNIGIANFANSTLLKKVNECPNDFTIKSEFAKWRKAGGQIVHGLEIRREKESNVYFTK